MFRYIGLNEDCGYVWVDTDREIDAREFSALLFKQLRILRNSYGVKINNTKEAFVFVLQVNPVA